MGGTEGSRGYLYQTFASIFEILCYDDWDKIILEYDSPNDKVDIALANNGKVFKSIQVKSCKNSFAKTSAIEWIKDLIEDDIGATEYELFLIGLIGPRLNEFINAILNYQKNGYSISGLTKKDINSLKEFDVSIINQNKLNFINRPFNIDDLINMIIVSLHKYISKKHIVLEYEKLNLIVKAMISDNFISSLGSEGITRIEFETKINDYINMLSNRVYNYKPIGVICYLRGSEYIHECTDIVLSLIDKYENRYLKSSYDWDRDIYNELSSFLIANTNSDERYQLMIEAPLSIAFACGRIFDSKSGRYALPSNPQIKKEVWSIEETHIEFNNFEVNDVILSETASDTVLIISITRDIKDNVLEYISEKHILPKRVIELKLQGNGPSNSAVLNGRHAYLLANQSVIALSNRSAVERRSNLHIFASAPAGFMFFLGQNSRGLGNCILYEYDFEAKITGSYFPSFTNLT